MKTIGLLGGMSWESTAIYYRLINQQVRQRLGGQHSARILMLSVDFAEVVDWQSNGDWQRAGERLAADARRLQDAGAELMILATNTMHKVAAPIEAALSIPFLHIADATAQRVAELGLQRVGLLGTRFTMEQDFYTGRLRERFGIDCLTPDASERDVVHRIIYEELCQGVVSEVSRSRYQAIIAGLQARGAQALIAGCTEIGLLIAQSHIELPLLDTTALHVDAAIKLALDDR